MSQIRPFIEMRVGQQQQPLRVPISSLLVDAPVTILTVNAAAGANQILVSSLEGFNFGVGGAYRLLIGEPGNPNSEVIQMDSTDSANTIFLETNLINPHSASTNVYLLLMHVVEFSHADTLLGSKTIISTEDVTANVTTDYNDTKYTSGFYFARFFEDSVGAVLTVSINTTGTGYHVGDVLTLTSGTGDATVTVATINGGGGLTGVTVSNPGTNNYITFTVSQVTGGHGTGAVIEIDSVAFFSPYSDDIPYDGYTIRSARSVIDSALNEINKQESQVLTDEFAFQQLDNVQTEIIQMLKRWSFMQLFDQTVGHTATGSWKFTLPSDIGFDDSNRSIYQLRVATQQRLTWVDKQKFDEFLVGVAYTTLALPALNGDLTLTLTDSSSFNSLASMTDGSGTVTIGANTYSYSANDTTTGILTLGSAITPTTTAPLGADVFQGATQGLPNYWTTYGNTAYYWPIASQSYNGFQLLMDYYTKQVKITSDSDYLVFPDPTVAIYYLCWKFLKKLANGSDTPDTQAYQALYEKRKEIMRTKEVMNRTFKFRPRIQNFSVQSAFNESTPRWIRDAEFPNTGF